MPHHTAVIPFCTADVEAADEGFYLQNGTVASSLTPPPPGLQQVLNKWLNQTSKFKRMKLLQPSQNS